MACALLGGIALAAAGACDSAWANGGAGGSSGRGVVGGAGGTPANPDGANGTSSTLGGGGGGGGSVSLTTGLGGSGGTGGTNNGDGSASAGGNGGAGGSFGIVITSGARLGTTSFSGTAGASGSGAASAGLAGGGGGGGEGGGGVLLTNTANTSSTSSGILSGAIGGSGGAGGSTNIRGGGGGGGGDGGAGVVLSGGGTLTSSGPVAQLNGGAGGSGGNGGFATRDLGGNGGTGGAGGAGAVVLTGGELNNGGVVVGGRGGIGGSGGSTDRIFGGNGGAGGAGGAGVAAGAGGTVDNSGAITGGSGGAGGSGGGAPDDPGSNGAAGLGGAGIVGSGLTITNTGTISGGLAANGITRADALDFTSGANTLMLSGTGGLTGNIAIGAGSVTFNQASAVSLANVITGAGAVVDFGPGTLTLTGSNSYTGDTSISSGAILRITNDGALASGTVAINGGSFEAGAPGLAIGNAFIMGSAGGTIGAPGETLTISGNISGGALVAESGTLVLSGDNTYTGGSTVAGTLRATNASAIGSGAVTLAGGMFQAGAARLAFANAFSLGAAGGTIDTQANNLTLSGAISGTGVLAKVGTGTLTLSGISSYIGATNVNAGTLEAGRANAFAAASTFSLASGATLDLGGFNQTIGSLAGAGSVALGSATLTTGGDSSTVFSGPISGTGSLAKVGAGALTLAAANSYSGGTSLDSGTLIIGNNAALGTGALAMAAGTTLSFASGSNFAITNAMQIAGDPAFAPPAGTVQTVSGVISDGASPGALDMNGAGTLVLTAANTYSGGTFISSGTLQATNASAVGSGTVTLAGGTFQAGAAGLAFANAFILGTAGGTIDTQANNLTLSSAISGTGVLAKIGTGSLTLSGIASYTGATNVNAGTLEAGRANVFAATSAFNVASGATLDLNGFNQTIGSLAGAGSVALGSATLTTGSDSNTVFSGTISGTGGLAKVGPGTLTLDGSSSGFTGSTTVQSGTLVIGDDANPAAQLGGNVTISAGASLRGDGKIGGSVVNNGTLQPGAAIGVLDIAGHYTQASNGRLVVEITPKASAGPGTGYDQVRIGGVASLAGALAVIDDAGTYILGSRYTVLTAAGGRSGTFSTVSYDPQFAGYITPAVTYDANNVYVTLEPIAAPVPALFSSAGQVPDVLTAMIGAMDGVGQAILGDVCSATAQRLRSQTEGCVAREAPGGMRSEVWMRGLGGIGNLTGSGSNASFDDNYAGVLIGGGVGWGGLTIGLGAGYLSDGINFSDGSSASQSTGLGFIYVRDEQGPLHLGAMAAYGAGMIDGTRVVPGTGLMANGNRHGAQATVRAGAAYDVPVRNFVIEPRATLAYIRAGQDSFSESGAGLLDLNYANSNVDAFEGRLLMRVKERFAVRDWQLTPWAEGGVQEIFSGLVRRVNVSAGTYSAEVSGISPAPTAGVAGVGVTAEATRSLELFLSYRGLFAANQTENVFTGGLTLRF